MNSIADAEHGAGWRETTRLLAAHFGSEKSERYATRLSGGHTNVTYLFPDLDIIVRFAPESETLFGPFQMGIRQQFDVLVDLHTLEHAVPTPEPLEYIDDPAIAGAPFFTMRRLPGDAFERELPDWFEHGDKQLRREMSMSYVTLFSRVHSLPLLRSLGAPRSNREEWQRWAKLAELGGSEPVIELFSRLLADVPKSVDQTSVVHGDPKMANILWRDGALEALIDWETAFNGDPLNDLGYMLTFVPGPGWDGYLGYNLDGMLSRSQLVETWAERTGRTVHSLARFEAAGMAKRAAIIAYGITLYQTNVAEDERFGLWALRLAKDVEYANYLLDGE